MSAGTGVTKTIVEDTVSSPAQAAGAVPKKMMEVKEWDTVHWDQGWRGELIAIGWHKVHGRVQETWQWHNNNFVSADSGKDNAKGPSTGKGRKGKGKGRKGRKGTGKGGRKGIGRKGTTKGKGTHQGKGAKKKPAAQN